MQERDSEYTQMEDRQSVLGMAKDIGLSYLNPFYRPELFQIRKGAFSLSPINSSMGIAKFLSNKIDKGQTYSRIRKSIYDSKGYDFLAAMENKSYYAPFKGSWRGSTSVHYKGNKLEDVMNLNGNGLLDVPPPPEPVVQTSNNSYVKKKSKSKKQKKINKVQPTKLVKPFDQQSSDTAFDRIYKRTSARRDKNFNKGFVQSTNRVMNRLQNEVGDFAKKHASGVSGTGRKLARIGTRVGIGALKGLAYYNVLSLAYDVTSWVAEPLGRSVINMIDYGSGRIKDIAQPELGGSLPLSYLSRGAATERQRAINAISKACINGRSNLGREASFL